MFTVDVKQYNNPHGLLLTKLRACGLSEEAVRLVDSYLSNRTQQIRLGSHTGTWKKLSKGVLQGSVLGPLLFNVFIKYILNQVSFLKKN